MAFYFTSVNSKVGGFYKSVNKQWRKWLYAGITLGVLIFIFPPLYGEGHSSFGALMSGETDGLFNNTLFMSLTESDWFLIIYLIAIMLFKVITMATTNAAGGVGGTFAPSLFVGAFAGASLAVICRDVFLLDVSITSFTLVGMAGVMSGVMKAPLTSIFLIAELSNGYGLFIPLMIVSGISFAVNFGLDRDSIYTKQLRMRGELLTHDKDSSAFVFLRLDELMETDFVRLREGTTLGDVVNIISVARRNIFPVVNTSGKLLGIVQLDDLRHDMFDRDKWDESILSYMVQPPDKIKQSESIQSIMPRFEQAKTWMLPVVDDDNRYLGFIAKSQILNAYRQALVNVSQAD
jgi:CIC family chloride channel protein